jgi:transposase
MATEALTRPGAAAARSGRACRRTSAPAHPAEGHSNRSIAETLIVSTGAVEKHVASILGKLELPPDGRSHRRVLAVLSYLRDES